MKRFLLSTFLALALAPAASASYERAGTYQHYDRVYPTMAAIRASWPMRGELPVVAVDGMLVRHPVNITQWGLANYSLWVRRHVRAGWVGALRAANWLVRNQRPNGMWTYPFSWQPIGSTQVLRPGWTSALAQGQSLSLLERVYRRTGQARYLRAMHKAFAALVGSRLVRSFDGGRFLEEYPTKEIDFSLNGDLQALMGLYDAEPFVPGAKGLFEAGATTLARVLPRFDDTSEDAPFYSLAFPHPVQDYNGWVHLELLILYRMSHLTAFSKYAHRWVTCCL